MKLDMETTKGQKKRSGVAAAFPGGLENFSSNGTDWQELERIALDWWADSSEVMVPVQFNTRELRYHPVTSGSWTHADF